MSLRHSIQSTPILALNFIFIDNALSVQYIKLQWHSWLTQRECLGFWGRMQGQRWYRHPGDGPRTKVMHVEDHSRVNTAVGMREDLMLPPRTQIWGHWDSSWASSHGQVICIARLVFQLSFHMCGTCKRSEEDIGCLPLSLWIPETETWSSLFQLWWLAGELWGSVWFCPCQYREQSTHAQC